VGEILRGEEREKSQTRRGDALLNVPWVFGGGRTRKDKSLRKLPKKGEKDSKWSLEEKVGSRRGKIVSEKWVRNRILGDKVS